MLNISPTFFLWIVSTFLTLYSEKILGMISDFCDFMDAQVVCQHVIYPGDVPHALEKNVYLAMLG